MITPKGWNTWDVRHLNAVVHLPTRRRVLFSLIDPATGQVKDEFSWRGDVRRLGPHATDGSYCQLDLQWNKAVVALEYAAEGDRLVCRVTPGPAAGALLLQIGIDGAWNSPASWEGWQVAVGWRAADSLPCRVALNNGPVWIEVAPHALETSETALSAFMAQRRAAYQQAGLRTAGWLNDAADAITHVIAWNTIWEPLKGRMCTPVSRDWCKGPFFGSYVLFEWDTFFCAVMAQLEDPNLAVANALAIVQEATAAGFVPNFGSEFGASVDRSQPPVGAYCVLKLYRAGALSTAQRNADLLERAFPTLARWHAWWMPHRDGNRDGLLEWGSDPTPSYHKEWLCNNMQAAMYESGLDNSPMYDEAVFNPDTHTMELADVGLNALYALDAWALSEIARELGQPTLSQNYAAEYAEMAERINRELWSEEAGIYLNKHWDGRLSPHLSPTLFYPLIAGIAPAERAERMVREHLLNEREFWGRFVLPSIARSDPGYAGNDYWRGRIWGPMNFLVSEGLRRYRLDDIAHQFARRSLDLLLREWQEEGHVHENYNTDTGDGDDMPNSDPMYTWGALLGYVAVQELIDCEPWAGWRFGSLNNEPAAVRGVRVGEGALDAASGPDGLRVWLNGAQIIATNQPAIITGYQRARTRLTCHVHMASSQGLTLQLGHLPVGQAVQVRVGHEPAQRRHTDQTGALSLSVPQPAQVTVMF